MYTQINHTELIICTETLTKTYIHLSSFYFEVVPLELADTRICLGNYFNISV